MQITNRFTPMMPQAQKPTLVQRMGNLEDEGYKLLDASKIISPLALEAMIKLYTRDRLRYRLSGQKIPLNLILNSKAVAQRARELGYSVKSLFTKTNKGLETELDHHQLALEVDEKLKIQAEREKLKRLFEKDD
jgi:hypothetical protein